MLDWVGAQADDRVVGIEGSGSYGAELARRLLEVRENVKEVPAFLAHRERTRNPSQGESDALDAVAIARVVARGEACRAPQK